MSFKVFGIAPVNVKLRVKLFDSATGQGKTGIDRTDANLRISTIQDGIGSGISGEAAPVVYQGNSTIEDITTLGTYEAPSANNCRFKEVSATNHPGLYEIHLANARLALASDPTKPMTLLVSISGVTGMSQQDLEIECGSTSHAVWNTLYALHTNSGTFGEYFYRMMSGAGARVAMYLRQLNIVAVGNDSAIDATGAGDGAGMKNTGGSNGPGQKNTGGTSGAGMLNTGNLQGAGMKNIGGPVAEAGLFNVGSGSGSGQRNYGGTSGNGITSQAGGFGYYGHEVIGSLAGQCNYANAGPGLLNQSGSHEGQKNEGVGHGLRNTASNGIGQSNEGGTNGEGMKNTGAGLGAGQMNTGGEGANGKGMYNRATGSADAMLNFGAGSGAGTKNVSTGTEGFALFNEATGLNGLAQYNHSTRGDAMRNLGGLNGMTNQGGTLGNGDGMKNVGAGTGKDLSAPINDLGLNNGTALTAQQVRDAMALGTAAGAAAGSVDKHLDDVLADTTTLKVDVITVDGVVDAIKVDTTTLKAAVDGEIDELTVGQSPVKPTLKQAIMRLYMKVRNKETATRSDASNGSEQVFNDAGTPILKKVYSDAGGTTTVQKDATP